jgi:hypothetical protein
VSARQPKRRRVRPAVVLCSAVAAIVATAPAWAKQPSPITSEAAYRRLSKVATSALGSNYACLVSVMDAYGNRTGLSLRITNRRGLATARRLQQRDPTIRTVEIVPDTFSRSAALQAFRDAVLTMKPYPEVLTTTDSTLANSTAPRQQCPATVRIMLGAGRSGELEAARAVQARHRAEILIAIAPTPAPA